MSGETKQQPVVDEDDDDGLGFDLNLSDDDDDDGLGFNLNLSDEDDGLPLELLSSGGEGSDDDMPEMEFESEFSKSQEPKPVKKTRKKLKHPCLKLPLIQSIINGAEGEKKKEVKKLFIKAGRSRDAVLNCEIQLKEARKAHREINDSYAKISVEKDVLLELDKAISSEKLIKELATIVTGLNTLKSTMKDNHKKMQEIKRDTANKGSKALEKLEKNKQTFLDKRQKYLSRQKVLRSAVVDYEESLANLEARIKIVQTIPEESYKKLTIVQENLKNLAKSKTSEDKSSKKLTKNAKKEKRIALESEELKILEILQPKVAKLTTHLIRIKKLKALKEEEKPLRKDLQELKIQLNADPNMIKSKQKAAAKKYGSKTNANEDEEEREGETKKNASPRPGQSLLRQPVKGNETQLSMESLKKTQMVLQEHNRLIQELDSKMKEFDTLQKENDVEHQAFLVSEKKTQRSEKKLKLTQTLEEREIKTCSTFVRSFGRKLLLEAHPDKLNRDPTEEERNKFESLQLAHSTLGNKDKLRQYLTDSSILKEKFEKVLKKNTKDGDTGKKKKKKGKDKHFRNKDVGAASDDDDDGDDGVMRIQGMAPGKCKKVYLMETNLITGNKKTGNKGELIFWWRAGTGSITSGNSNFELQMKKDEIGEKYQTVYSGTSDTWTSPPIDLAAYNIRVREINNFGPGMWSVDLHVVSLEKVRQNTAGRKDDQLLRLKRAILMNIEQLKSSMEKLQGVQSTLNWTMSHQEDGVRYGCSMLRSAVLTMDKHLLKFDTVDKKSKQLLSPAKKEELDFLLLQAETLQSLSHEQLEGLQGRANKISREKADAKSMFDQALIGVGGDAIQLEQCQYWLHDLDLKILQASTRNYIFQKLEHAAAKFSAAKGSCSATYLKSQEIFSKDAVRIRTFGERLIILLKLSIEKLSAGSTEMSVKKQIKSLDTQLKLMIEHESQWKKLQNQHVRQITQMKKAEEEYRQSRQNEQSEETKRRLRYDRFLEEERLRAAGMSTSSKNAIQKLLAQPKGRNGGQASSSSAKPKNEKQRLEQERNRMAREREEYRLQKIRDDKYKKYQKEQEEIKRKAAIKASLPTQPWDKPEGNGFTVTTHQCKIKDRTMLVNKISLSAPFLPSDFATVQRVIIGKKNQNQQNLLKHSKCNVVVSQRKPGKALTIPLYLKPFVKPNDQLFCFLLATSNSDLTKGTRIVFGRLLSEEQRRMASSNSKNPIGSEKMSYRKADGTLLHTPKTEMKKRKDKNIQANVLKARKDAEKRLKQAKLKKLDNKTASFKSLNKMANNQNARDEERAETKRLRLLKQAKEEARNNLLSQQRQLAEIQRQRGLGRNVTPPRSSASTSTTSSSANSPSNSNGSSSWQPPTNNNLDFGFGSSTTTSNSTNSSNWNNPSSSGQAGLPYPHSSADAQTEALLNMAASVFAPTSNTSSSSNQAQVEGNWFDNFITITKTESYRRTFVDEECTDMETLQMFTDSDFSELGIKKGARIRILKYLKNPSASSSSSGGNLTAPPYVPQQNYHPPPQQQQQQQYGHGQQTNNGYGGYQRGGQPPQPTYNQQPQQGSYGSYGNNW